MLVIAAGLLVESLWNLSNPNPGFRSENIVTARITPNQSFCAEAGRCQTFYTTCVDACARLPGVNDVAAVNGLPLSGTWDTIPSDVEGRASCRRSARADADGASQSRRTICALWEFRCCKAAR